MENFISHSLIIMMGVFLIIFVIVMGNNLKSQYKDFISENEIDHVCLLVKGGISKIYVTGNSLTLGNDTLGSISIKMPEKIADTKYRALLFNTSLEIETFFSPSKNVTCSIGLSGVYKGFSTGGPTQVIVYQYANGTKVIEMKNI